MRKFVSIAGLVAWSASSFAQQPLPLLVAIGTNSAGAEILVDRASLRASRPVDAPRGVTTMLLSAEIRSPGGRRAGMQTERMLFSFNCAARTLNVLTYYKSWANGARSHDWRAADLMRKYETPRSGSLAELAMIYACSGGRLPLPPANGSETIGDEDDG